MSTITEEEREIKMDTLLKDPILRPLLEDLCQWLARILVIDITPQNFTVPLRTGDDLCRLGLAISKKAKEMNKDCPSLKYKPGAKPGSFQARCNIEAFVKWAKALGVRETCLFETGDIIELKYLRNVLICLLEISKLAADVYGVEPPQLVKLEKSTKISWDNLIKLSMKKMGSNDKDAAGGVLSLSDITSSIGAIQQEVADSEADGGVTRSSSVVKKWREFARSSVKSRTSRSPGAGSPSIIEAVIEDPSSSLTDSGDVMSFKTAEGPTSTSSNLEIEEVTAESPDKSEVILSLDEENVEDEEVEDIGVSVSEVRTVKASPPPQYSQGGYDNPGYEDDADGSSTDLQQSTTTMKGPEGDGSSREQHGTININLTQTPLQIPVCAGAEGEEEESVTWCLALCFPAIQLQDKLTEEQYDQLDSKRRVFLLLGILLTLIGTGLAVTDAVLGIDTDGTSTPWSIHGASGKLSTGAFFLILGFGLAAIIAGLSLISLWIVQHWKIKNRKLIDYASLPSYGTMG